MQPTQTSCFLSSALGLLFFHTAANNPSKNSLLIQPFSCHLTMIPLFSCLPRILVVVTCYHMWIPPPWWSLAPFQHLKFWSQDRFYPDNDSIIWLKLGIDWQILFGSGCNFAILQGQIKSLRSIKLLLCWQSVTVKLLHKDKNCSSIWQVQTNPHWPWYDTVFCWMIWWSSCALYFIASHETGITFFLCTQNWIISCSSY